MAETQLSHTVVETYLKNNPDFAKAWYNKHGHKLELNKAGSKTETLEARDSQLDLAVPQISSGRNSITTEMFKDLVSGRKRNAMKNSLARKNRNSLQEMSEKDLFMELIRDIANELDVNVLCHKILLNVSILTHSDRGSLFLARGSNDGNRFLVSKLFDVTEHSSLESSLHTEENEIKVPFGKGIAGYVAETKDTVNIKEAYEDSRFNKEVDNQTGYRTHSILCMPILNYDGEVIGVAQIINKTTGDHEFTAADERVFRDYLTFCGIGLTNAQLFEMSVQEYKRNQLLLGLAKGIFEEQSSLELLVRKIMMESQELLLCERCIVYIIDDALGKDVMFSKAFLLNAKETPKPSSGVDENISKLYSLDAYANTLSPAEIEKSKNAEIARLVATTGETVNISDAENDSKFKSGVVDYDGFKTHMMLCLPIFNSEKRVIGIAQLMNKSNSKPFNENDINILHAFAIFCGLGIHNTQMYENACRLMAKQSVALEVLSYHATAQPEETDKLKTAVIPSAADFKLYTYEFNDLILSEDETCKATLRMFMECDIINKFHVPYQNLCRWILSVKKNYRQVIYHNWRHAFNVAQTMFTMIHTGLMAQYLNDLEVFGLLVACLCHDLDHRGTNNAFQSKVDSPLAVLYSTSTMEHHHFDHSIMILNSEGNNIFESLSSEDYKTMLKLLEGAILSTDLALYFKKRGSFEALVEGGEKEWKDKEKKELLRGMMMTACDVAAITKPWEVQREVAQLVASEFFEQGDMERSKLNMEPMAMMDRKKKDELPKMQVGFIDAICLPVYKMFANIEQHLDPLYSGCLNNRREWQALADNNIGVTPKINDMDKKSGTPETSKKQDVNADVSENNRRNTQQSLSNKSDGPPRQKADVKTRTCSLL